MIHHEFNGDRLERLVVESGSIHIERASDNRLQIQIFDAESDEYAQVVLSALSEITAEVEEG